MKKEVLPAQVLVAVVLTYLISKFFFSVFDFSYNFFSNNSFDLIDTLIQFVVYVIVFPLVYNQIGFLFNRKVRGNE